MLKRGFQIVLLLVVVLLVPLSVAGIWVRQVVGDESSFVTSMQDLPSDPEVQDAMVRLVGDAVSSRVTTDWEAFVTSTVSSRTIQNQLLSLDPDVRGFVEDQARAVIQDPSFKPVWVSIVEAAHPLVLDILRGNDSTAVEAANGDIELNVSPVYNAVVKSLAEQGIDLTRVLPSQIDDLSLTVYDSPSLATTQRVARLIDRWSIPLAVLAVVLAVLVVVISRRKVLAGAVVGLTVVLSMAGTLFGLTVVLDRVLDRHLEPVQRDAALAIIREVTTSLREWLLAIGIAGGVVMVVCLVAQFLIRRSPDAASYH